MKYIDSINNSIYEIAKNENSITGVATKIVSLDKYIGGFQPSDMVVIAGRPGIGKTTFALNLAYNISESMKKVLYFSLEMSGEQLIKRILSSLSFESNDKLMTDKIMIDDMKKNKQNMYEIINKNIDIYDNANLSIDDLRNVCMKKKAESGLDIVFIDYLQLMSIGDNYKKSNENSFVTRQEEVKAISREIKMLVKELNVPIIILSQLSCHADTKKGPQLSELRESYSIEQDADIVMLIKKSKNDQNEKSDKTEIFIVKHKNGSTGTINLKFDKFTTRYTEWDINTNV